MESVKVFGLPASTDVARVLTCLFEKDVGFQLIRTDTYNSNHKVPEFLKLQNPEGQVTYKEGKVTLVDSREICRHISDKYVDQGNKLLLGTGALERASIEQWLQAESQNFNTPSSVLLFNLAFAEPLGIVPIEYVIEQNKDKLSRVLDVYERRLTESDFLAGDDFTLADLTHLPNSHYLITRSEQGRDLFLSRKNVARWWKAISGRNSWKTVVNLQREHPGPLEKFTITKPNQAQPNQASSPNHLGSAEKFTITKPNQAQPNQASSPDHLGSATREKFSI